jgi:hypothetical protein
MVTAATDSKLALQGAVVLACLKQWKHGDHASNSNCQEYVKTDGIRKCNKTSPTSVRKYLKSVRNMSGPNTRQTHVPKVSEKYPKSVKHISNTYEKHVRKVSKTCPTSLRKVPNKCPKCVQQFWTSVQQTCPTSVRNISDTCQQSVKQSVKQLSEIYQTHVNQLSKHVKSVPTMSDKCPNNVQQVSHKHPTSLPIMSNKCPKSVFTIRRRICLVFVFAFNSSRPEALSPLFRLFNGSSMK